MTDSSGASFGYTIFCDDIRYELGNKISLVGVYGDEMFLSGASFPITIPKIGMAICITTPLSMMPEEIELRVYLPGKADPAHVANLTASDHPAYPAAQSELSENALSDDRIATFNFHVILSPAVIPEPGRIKVRAIVDEELMKLGTLAISTSPQQSVDAVSESA